MMRISLSAAAITVATVGMALPSLAHAEPTPHFLDQFESLTESEKQQIQEHFNVDSIFDIPMNGKSVLTPHYYTRPGQYSQVTSDKDFEWNPHWLIESLKNRTDGRRPADIPEYSPYNCPCLRSLLNSRQAVIGLELEEGESASNEDLEALYRSYRNVIPQNAYSRSALRFGDQRNFRTYDNYQMRIGETTRW